MTGAKSDHKLSSIGRRFGTEFSTNSSQEKENAMETGAFGWGFKDYIQPVMDDYDRRINDILSNGVHAEIAWMQAHDQVAFPVSESGAGAVGMPSFGSREHA
ncbi:MAG: hypothetical protein JSR25_10115 [Proteobacteria bacterium]|nr:hypothetical protein [Pseudomonadota bacterium]